MDTTQLQQQIDELKTQIEELKSVFPLNMRAEQMDKRDVPLYLTTTAGTPSTNGSITVEINGLPIKLMTTV
jgi:TolA-binding protein